MRWAYLIGWESFSQLAPEPVEAVAVLTRLTWRKPPKRASLTQIIDQQTQSHNHAQRRNPFG